jgi:hypothetical protein
MKKSRSEAAALQRERLDREAFKRGEWRTADGQCVPIQEMGVDHILRSCAKIMRDTTWRVYYLPALVEELDRRGVTFGGNDGKSPDETN